MNVKKHLILLMMSRCGLVWADQPPPPDEGGQRTQIRAAQLYGWRPIDGEHLLLWTGKEEVWRLSVAPSCPSLNRARNIVVTADRRHIKVGRDRVQIDDQECLIRELAFPEVPDNKKRPVPKKGYVATLSVVESVPETKPTPTQKGPK